MKSTRLVALLLTASLALTASRARAGAPLWVNRTPTEFNALLDADGDGDLDAVVADRATGLLRVARRAGPTTFTWETPAQSGIAPLDSLAAGAVVTNTRQSVALAGMLANRVALVDLASASAALVPKPLFPRHAGPRLVVALDALPASDGDELLVTTDLNGGTSGSHRQLFRHLADGSPAEDSYSAGTTYPSFCAAITATNNAVPRVAALVPSSDRIWLFNAITNAATLGPYQSVGVIDGTQFVYGFFAPGAEYGQFLLYAPGTASARRVALQANATHGAAFGPSSSYTLPAVPWHLAPGPGTNEVTLIATNGSAAVYTYNGTTLTLVNTLALPAGAAGTFLGCLTDPSTGATLLLLDTDGDGRTDQSCRYGLSGGQYVAQDSPASLPSLANREARPNTLAFVGEPLVASNATRIAAYAVSDWSTAKSGVTPNATVYAAADRGETLGLNTSSAAYTVSGVPADATHILVDQLATGIGVQPLFAAAGESVSAVRVDPAGGAFDNAVQVTLTAPASADRILYRLSATDTWIEHIGVTLSFWLFKDTTVQCFGFKNSNSRTSPITSASFSFTGSPESQDSDGDGVPDFVELQLGLDPTSGQDADDDGLSDLDELLGGTQPGNADSDSDGFTDRQERAAGTNPNSAASKPTEEEAQTLDGNDLTANERLAVYDLRLGPTPYNGFLQYNTACATNVPCLVTALDGSLLGTAATRWNGFPGIQNPSLAFGGLPAPFAGLLAGFTTPAHYDISTTNADKTIGRELVKLIVAPTVAPVAVAYAWSGGSQSSETTAWTNAAHTAYSGASRTVVSNSVNYYDTLAAALFEAFVASNIQSRGLFDTNALSLFPARAEPADLPHPTADQLLALQSYDAGGRPAYRLTNTLDWLRRSCETSLYSQVSTLRTTTRSIYRYACTQNNDAPGQYPLPLDALRQLLRTGTVPGGYTNYVSSSTAASAKLGADYLLGHIPVRSLVTLDLLAGGPQPPDTTVLADPDTGLRYSLVEPDGDAFGMSLALAVPSNSTVSVDGFLNGPDVRRGADFEIEVVSLTVTALPAPSPTDLNANLIPDDYELLVFGAAGAAPSRDLDGDTFSDLQEYLENTDPTDPASVPGVDPAALGAPEVTITVDGAAVTVAWAWPARYQSRFSFTVETTDDLRNTPFAVHGTAAASGDGDAMRCDLPLTPEGPTRFYRVRVALR